jgi:16S rRNA (guanine966-N2)-methyltransferase
MAATGSSGSVRLIAGQWRGRKLPIVDVEGLRPTGDRVKETLFNWLQTQIPGARCLDLFAGSGSLGFEAASRGAAEVIMVERDPTVVGCLQASAERLSAAQVTILQTDAAAYLQTSPDPFDIVFLDPPFQSSLLVDMCERLINNPLLTRGARIYLEAGRKQGLPPLPVGLELLKSADAGDVAYHLAQVMDAK